MSSNSGGGFKETVSTVIYAVIIALGIRTFAYEPFNIPSGSMIPTLLVGDYLFVSKLSFGYSRYSLPWSLPLITDRIFFSEPERGDVVVFRLPTNTKVDYIKRLVGLPGDTIQVIQGVLQINGKAVVREKTDDYLSTDSLGNVRRTTRYLETLPGGRTHYILESMGDYGSADNTDVYTVPAGHYFAMGDNRDNSQDSRYLDVVGFIPRENLIGRANFLFFSIDGVGWNGFEFWKWPGKIRFGRLLNGIE
ncbi:MAG TPA: signal peptidase I [Rhodospirillales bacterium]|nr:signal peptidase I [Rhodospirillales bacterium]